MKRRRTSTAPTVSPPSSSSEEGELTPEAERAQIDAQIAHDIATGTRDVAQKDARYFMLENIVCQNCGTKGHMSYDCTEEQETPRCFICGSQEHTSRDCPDDGCFDCGGKGHRAKDCTERRKRRRRIVGPARNFDLDCYVCGEIGHLDCGLREMPTGVMSCCNCGQRGHTKIGCDIASVDRVVPIAFDMERERKAKKKEGKGGKENPEVAAKEYRAMLMDRVKKQRYNRASRPSR